VALGHAELIEQAATDKQVAEDACAVVGELGRLGRVAGRLLLLTSVQDPGFLDLAPVPADSMVIDALDRWGHAPLAARRADRGQHPGRPRPPRGRGGRGKRDRPHRCR
jgi:hypothetical protein